MLPITPSKSAVALRPLQTRWLAVSAFCAVSLICFCLFSLTAGCGTSERQRVQTVSDQFLEAMTAEDWTRAKPLLTEKARDAMGQNNFFAPDGTAHDTPKASPTAGAETYTIGDPIVEEQTASVPVTMTRAGRTVPGMLRLRREDGEWRVRALRIEGEGDAPGITLDFENPEAALLGAAFRALGEGMGEMLKGFGQGMGAFLKGVEKASEPAKKSESSPNTPASPEPESSGR